MRYLKIISIPTIIVLAVGAYWLADYFAWFADNPLETNNPKQILDQETYQDNQNIESVDYQINTVAENLEVPWSIAFTDTNRMLVSERPGRIRVIIDGQLQDQALKAFSEVSSQAEEGLMGLTVDPNYEQNGWLYVCLAYQKDGQLVDKVLRFTDPERTDLDQTEQVILDDIPAARFHAGCRIKFGPDDKLYITTGDATDKQIAQDLDSLGGKILRINANGSIPQDNPFTNSPIYSYGHRNPQGIAWHPTSKQLWSTEHGPSIFDGPAGGDEVNLIKAGENYGWPLVSHQESQPGLEDPKLVFTPAIAPGSATFYNGNLFPQFKNNLFFTGLKGEALIRAVMASNNPEQIAFYKKMPEVNFGRIREVITGPDGFIYFTTSNRDGRGEIREGDDKIYRIINKK